MCQETTANTSLCSFRHTKDVSGDVVNFYASFPFFFGISENVFANPCSITSTERITSTCTEIANECIATNPNGCTK